MAALRTQPSMMAPAHLFFTRSMAMLLPSSAAAAGYG
jgi:hypothetical protein